MDEILSTLSFSVFPGIGPKRFQVLLKYFNSAESAYNASEEQLKKSGLGESLIGKFLQFRKDFDTQVYLNKLKEKEVNFLTIQNPNYPSLLREIPDPPFVLYYKGEFEFNSSENQKTVGVVGTRKITSYGRTVTEMLTSDLVNAGCVIVSGLAMGVDAVAHSTTIENKGRTIAVLGCGVDCCNPTSNQRLYEKIIDQEGVVVSEFPLGQAPSIGSFPSRNRIIAGLSQVVLVTEGASDSGALITAEDAFQIKRKVFAVPGPITSNLSTGPNSLLLKGGKLVTSSKDILDGFGLKASINSKKEIKGDTEEEQKIIDLLNNESLLFDQIVKLLKSNAQEVGIVLSLMEVKGQIMREGDSYKLS